MPNGRSGGFVIEMADLKKLVQAVSGDTLVGQLSRGSKPLQTASATDITRCLEECPDERIEVEEQDLAFYVLHISNEPIFWLAVHSESPIFIELRNRHTRWMAEHPGWNGWIGY